LTDQLRQTIRTRTLFAPGDGVVVAVSGGPDSLALLHALHEIGGDWSLRLVVAHLDHAIRGEAGVEDAAFVAAEAARLGLPHVVERQDVPVLADARRLSLEQAGREARYAFYGRVAIERGCARVATGHTADDRAETVLLNLLRGTGIDGLSGIPPRRPLCDGAASLEVVRPLIDCRRGQVLSYCDAHGLSPRRDSTNDSLEPTRNRIRHELIPYLEREFRPGIRHLLVRLADLAEEDGALLRALGRRLLADATTAHTGNGLRLDRLALAGAPPALVRRALREAVRSIDGIAPAYQSADALFRLACGERATGITMPESGVRAAVQAGTLALTPPVETGVAPAPAVERPLPIPGSVAMPEAGTRVQAVIAPTPAEVRSDPGSAACLNLDLIHPPVIVRFPRPGDRIVPLGMAGHRKLHDLFIDRKIPRSQRSRVLVVTDADRILWVVGCCVSEEAKVTGDTKQVVRLTAIPQGE
jgi:tRNA(Ile)-lysidine synthase